VTVSGLTNSTAAGIAVLWVVLDGGGFALDLLPPSFPSPDRALHRLPHVLHGEYNLRALGELIAWSAGVSFATSLVGLFWFARARRVRPSLGSSACGGGKDARRSKPPWFQTVSLPRGSVFASA
jgi:hypothetical protein